MPLHDGTGPRSTGDGPASASSAASGSPAGAPGAPRGAEVDEESLPLLRLGDDEELEVLASNDEWAFRRADVLQERLPARTGGPDRRTESEVFDQPTLLALHKMLVHGLIKSLDYPVATGKEANVFRATTPRGGFLAVKIYRINTSTFKHVLQYIQGDERFGGVTGDKRGLVHAWCQKEFRNLVRLREVGVSVPEPVKATGNILVTEYIGKREGPWPTLKNLGELPHDGTAERLWRNLADEYVTAYNEADLIHADLSEYNILVENSDRASSKWVPRVIDVGQAVLKTHPMGSEFLERDLKNLTTYFRRQRIEADPRLIRDRLNHERRRRTSDDRPPADSEDSEE